MRIWRGPPSVPHLRAPAAFRPTRNLQERISALDIAALDPKFHQHCESCLKSGECPEEACRLREEDNDAAIQRNRKMKEKFLEQTARISEKIDTIRDLLNQGAQLSSNLPSENIRRRIGGNREKLDTSAGSGSGGLGAGQAAKPPRRDMIDDSFLGRGSSSASSQGGGSADSSSSGSGAAATDPASGKRNGKDNLKHLEGSQVRGLYGAGHGEEGSLHLDNSLASNSNKRPRSPEPGLGRSALSRASSGRTNAQLQADAHYEAYLREWDKQLQNMQLQSLEENAGNEDQGARVQNAYIKTEEAENEDAGGDDEYTGNWI